MYVCEEVFIQLEEKLLVNYLVKINLAIAFNV